MGEYARYRRQSVKIGTCEDMYYLRADQVNLVTPELGSCDPRRPDVQRVIRFRFPWPDEDGVAPGAFDPYDRSAGLHGVTLPAGLEHHLVQFVARAGYNVCLPCPESLPSLVLPLAGNLAARWPALSIHRNGFAGAFQLVQQAYRAGVLAVIGKCGGCGARFNLPTLADAEPVIVACRAEGDRREQQDAGMGKWWHTVADRIAAGYGVTDGAR
jgi:hypothetical protein